MQKKKSTQLRYSDNCQLHAYPDSDEDIYSHQDQHQIEHNYIRQKNILDNIQKYRSYMQEISNPLSISKTNVIDFFKNIQKQIELQAQIILQSLNDQIVSFDSYNNHMANHIKYKKCIQSNTFKDLNCKQMAEFIKFINLKDQNKEKRFLKVKQQCLIKQKQIEKQLSSFQLNFKQKLGQLKQQITKISQNIQQPALFDVSQISKIMTNESTVSFSILSELKEQEKQIDNQKQVPKNHQKSKQENKSQNYLQLQQEHTNSEIIEQDDQDYYKYVHVENKKTTQNEKQSDKITQKEQQQMLFDINFQNIPSNKTLNQTSTMTLTQSQLKAITLIQSDNEQQEQTWQSVKENYQQMIKRHNQIFKQKDTIPQQKQDQPFVTMRGLSDLQSTPEQWDKYTFNLKIKVVKILYYFVIKKIPKVKFIAGDQTGLSVFFTNYSPQIQPQVELLMYDCQFFTYKSSIEIKNNQKFTVKTNILNPIKVNYKGIFLNQYIDKQTFYYQIPDKNCVLIRQIVQKLKIKQSFKVFSMTVEISYILSEWNHGIFCQISDSSGMMFAYIQKQKNLVYKQGDVIKLMKIQANYNYQKNKLLKQKICFIDTYLQKSIIKSFQHPFLRCEKELVLIDHL